MISSSVGIKLSDCLPTWGLSSKDGLIKLMQYRKGMLRAVCFFQKTDANDNQIAENVYISILKDLPNQL